MASARAADALRQHELTFVDETGWQVDTEPPVTRTTRTPVVSESKQARTDKLVHIANCADVTAYSLVT